MPTRSQVKTVNRKKTVKKRAPKKKASSRRGRRLVRNATKYKEMGVDFDPYALLYEHADDPYAFVHYSDIEKLGLNPSSEFDTPLGIYSYPLNQFSVDDIITGRVPFAGDRKYIHLFTADPDGIVFVNDTTSKQEAHFESKAEKYANHLGLRLDDARVQTPLGRYWYASMKGSEGSSLEWRYILVEDGIKGVVDYGAGIIHPNESTQAVFFSKSSLNHIGTFHVKAPMEPEEIQRIARRKDPSFDAREFLDRQKFKTLDAIDFVADLNHDQLPKFIDHPEPGVREIVAKRIDPEYLPQMMADKTFWVRFSVAERIDPEYLPQMIADKDYGVRDVVANRIDPEHLPQMMADKDYKVRAIVARRIDPEYLPEMVSDERTEVREVVAERIDPEHLLQMADDNDWSVRVIVAERIDPEYLSNMTEDPAPAVRRIVAERIDDKGIFKMMGDEDIIVADIVNSRMVDIQDDRDGDLEDNPKKKRAKKSPSRKLIDNCRKHWDAYCERPTKTNLKRVFKHLDKMAESKVKSVKDERRKCMRAAKIEAKELGLKV